MRGRRGVLSDYIAAVRGTMAMRRARGQARIELAFAGAAMVVAFVGFYTVFVQSGTASSSDEARSALGLPADDGRLMIGDGDGFIVDDGSAGGAGAEPGPDGIDGAGVGSADGPVTTGPDGVPVGTSGAGVLPSGDTPGEGTPGLPGAGGAGGGEGEGGTETSLPPTSPTEPGTSTSTSTPTSEPGAPGTTTTTTEPAPGGVVEAILDLLGL